MDNKTILWKDNLKCAAMITINLDAQYFGKIYYPDLDVNQGECLTLGKTSLKEYLPTVLYSLDRYGAKASFIIPGAVAREYPDVIREIAERGHEIGCHGNYHENLALLTAEEQEKTLREALLSLEMISGKPTVGFRMPEGEINRDTLRIVKKLGFCYSSSLSDDDVPYIDKETGLVELPNHWELFDLPYFVFTWDPPIPNGQSRASNMKDVLENWLYELEGAKRFGTLFNLQLDPLTAGEQGRIYMLDTILEKITSDPEIWLATGKEIAEYILML